MSSLKDLASLIMVPSLVKDGRLDTVKPLGNSIIHPDATGNNDGTDGSTPSEGNFTFSRGSNLAATRVDVNGLIEKGRENLLLQSNQFDTTWGIVGAASVAGGQVGYDGTNDAWLLSKTAAWSNVSQSISNSGVKTFSVYAKANASDWGLLVLSTGATDPVAYFDLVNGVVGVNASNIDAVITPISNGWYRILIIASQTINAVRIYPAEANTASGASGSIYIQDAQLEQSMVATDYIETGASTAQSGILEDLPRLDYSGGASCPSLLLEPQRTNKANYSEGYVGYQTSTSGTGVAPVVSQNAAVSPDGTQNAFRVDLNRGTGNTGSDWSWIYQSNIGYVGSNVISVYLKAATSNDIGKEIAIRAAGGSNAVVLTADWKRHEIIKTSTATSDLGLYSRGGENADNAVSCYVYGWQVENNSSYPTSYIPTMGSAVTRSYDSCNLLDLVSKDIITDSTEWTIMFDVKGHSEDFDSGDSQFYAGQNSTIDLYMRSNHTSGKFARFYWRKDSKYIGSAFGKKVIARLSGGIGTTFADGVLNGSSSINGNYDLIGFAKSANTSTSGFINQILIFPTALTDSECIALTTL